MDNNTPSYNLKVVVRETGIKPDTLRAWERRYGLPNPVRTEGGHRLYSQRDIDMIKWFMHQQETGMRISQAVDSWNRMVAEGTDPLKPAWKPSDLQPALAELPPDSALAKLGQAWLDACLRFDEIAAEQILTLAFARYPAETVAAEVLQKGLAAVGDRWYKGEVTVQQEHFTSALAIRRLNALVASAPPPTQSARILIGCPPGEDHVFSSQMVNLLLRHQGYDVTYLGANVPLVHLESTIQTVDADLAVFTAMTLDTAASLLTVADYLKEAGIPVAFGGLIFYRIPQLINRIPGFFLGTALNEIVSEIAKILRGGAQEIDPPANSAANLSALSAFERALPSIEAALIEEFAARNFPYQNMEMVNSHLGANIRSALVLGDIDLLTFEIAWTETLLTNNGIPRDLLYDYLQLYRQKMERLIGEEGSVIMNWFSRLFAESETRS